MSSDEEEERPKCSFAVYLAEGEALYSKGLYKKAIESFNYALDIEHDEKTALVARSKCYYMLGGLETALKDAELALTIDRNDPHALYQKAQCLYTMGNFEFALVYYHRGSKIRPEQERYRLGIQKSQEAIINCIGNPSAWRLQILDIPRKEQERKSFSFSQQKPNKRSQEHQRMKSERTSKKLLGPLYQEKSYLEQMKKMGSLKRCKTQPIETVQNLIEQGLNYLQTRSEFWRQQKPLYAEEYEKRLAQEKVVTTRSQNLNRAVKNILHSLEMIDYAQESGNYEESLKMAKETVEALKHMPEKPYFNKKEVLGTLYGYMGNACLELGQERRALQYHKKDLALAERHYLEEGLSRALDNLGRVYAKCGMFDEAIHLWERKIPKAQSDCEKAWLYHECGRCYLEMGELQEALFHGEKAMESAVRGDDEVWAMNASVLIGQSLVELRDYVHAAEYLERALDVAQRNHDDKASEAIRDVLDDVNKRIEEHPIEKPGTGSDESEDMKVKDDKTVPMTETNVQEKNEELVGLGTDTIEAAVQDVTREPVETTNAIVCNIDTKEILQDDAKPDDSNK